MNSASFAQRLLDMLLCGSDSIESCLPTAVSVHRSDRDGGSESVAVATSSLEHRTGHSYAHYGTWVNDGWLFPGGWVESFMLEL